MGPVAFRVAKVDFYQRDVTLRLPFRFGAATLSGCPQVFARARIVLADGRTTDGAAAELLLPKWFDKSPSKSNAHNIADLAGALETAAAAYVADATPRSAFGHHAAHYRELVDASDPSNLLLHHFSIGSKASRTAYALPDRMALIYHNITPPEYFAGIHRTLARQCFRGRREIRAYVERCDLATN